MVVRNRENEWGQAKEGTQKGLGRAIVRGILVLMTGLGLVSGLVLFAWYFHYQQQVTSASKDKLTTLTRSAATSIDAIVAGVMADVADVVLQLETEQLDHATAMQVLLQRLDQHPNYYGAAVSYQPFAFNPQQQLFSEFLVKKGGGVRLVRIDQQYDYTQPRHEWYAVALYQGGGWTQPYFGGAAHSFIVSYSLPFYEVSDSGAKRIKGVVTVDLAMDRIRQIIESLDLGATGFGALVSGSGNYLYHPDRTLVAKGKNLKDLAVELNDPDRLVLAEKAAARASGIIDHRSTSTGLDSWLIYTPIAATGWSLQNTFIKDGLAWDHRLIRHQLVGIALSVVEFCFGLTLLFVVRRPDSRRRMWWCAVFMALSFCAGIGGLWGIALEQTESRSRIGMRITDRAMLQHVMNSFSATSAARHSEPPVFVVTGIYLETLQLTNNDELALSGYVWQKYRLGELDDLPRGFTLKGASQLKSQEICRNNEGGYQVIRWSFQARVPQNLDHRYYPLDQAVLEVALMHAELNHNVVLIPDIDAYRFLHPLALPGVAPGLRLAGWKLLGSFLDLRSQGYATNFGLHKSIMKEDFPALHFNLVIQRFLLDAFISNLTAIIIVSIILFILLLLTSRDEKRVSYLQAGCGRILNICSGMFFIIAFSHIDIRSRVASEQIFYLEYFYFLIYLAILLVALNAVLFSTGSGGRLIAYRENLLCKVLYWPFFLGLLFLMTAINFY